MSCLPMVLILLGVIGAATGARIILVPPQLGSHIMEQLVIGEELVSRGHEVYVTMGSPFKWLHDIEKRGLKPLIFKFPDSVVYGVSDEFENAMASVIMGEDKDKLPASFRLAERQCSRDCEYMMNDENFLRRIKEMSFDLAVVEAFIATSCNFILPKFLGIPFVSTALMYRPWQHRFPALPSFVPLLMVWTSAEDINFVSRIQNLFNYARIDAIFDSMTPENTSLLQRFSPEIKIWNELVHLSEIFFVSTDHHLVSAVPQMPNYVSIAGSSASKAKALPPELEEIMANAKTNGAIIMSFGSSASHFPKEVIVKLLGAFAKCNQTVLARLSIPEGEPVPRNVKALRWLPQNDLLGHPNTKLFITHCGNNGLHEALYHGVPMVGFPLFAEQALNCERMSKKGLGLEMVIQDFTSKELFENIQEVLSDPKYRATVEGLSERFRDQPEHPLDRAAFWIEHVIKYGGKHLRPISMDMPLYQFLMLDVLGLLVAVVFLAICAMLIVGKYIDKKCFRSSIKSNTKLQSKAKPN